MRLSGSTSLYDTEKLGSEMYNRSYPVSFNSSQGVNHSCVKLPQSVAMAVKVNARMWRWIRHLLAGIRFHSPCSRSVMLHGTWFRLQLRTSRFCCLYLFPHWLCLWHPAHCLKYETGSWENAVYICRLCLLNSALYLKYQTRCLFLHWLYLSVSTQFLEY